MTRTHRGLSIFGVECGRRVKEALFRENQLLEYDRLQAIRRRVLVLPFGRHPFYAPAEQDLHQEAFGSVNSYHEPWPSCPCETCEDRRRDELVRSYPNLRELGLSPKAWGYEMEEVL